MSQRRVVLAEDDTVTRMDLREMLTRLGYAVVGEATEGGSAVDLARRLRPDIVIMDVKMPDIDGIVAAQMLARDSVAPVLLLTAYSHAELIERAKQAGVVAYVGKPVRENELAAALEIALAQSQRLRELEHEVGELKDNLETRKLVDRARGILMKTQGLSEEEAFRRIQKMSMNSRRSMKAIAEAIIITHEADAGC